MKKWIGVFLVFIAQSVFAQPQAAAPEIINDSLNANNLPVLQPYTVPPPDNLGTFLQGTTSENAVFGGMWTYHLNPSSRDDRGNNELFGVLYHNFFAGTLMNSFDHRAFALGVQRNVYVHQFSHHWQYITSYRLGLMSGYKYGQSPFSPLSKYSPVIPFPQLISAFQYRSFGWEISWALVVVSTSFYVTF